MVNLKKQSLRNKLFRKFTKKQHRNIPEQPFKNYFETVSPIILAALWTIYVLLWTITVINFNRALENLDARGRSIITSR